MGSWGLMWPMLTENACSLGFHNSKHVPTLFFTVSCCLFCFVCLLLLFAGCEWGEGMRVGGYKGYTGQERTDRVS